MMTWLGSIGYASSPPSVVRAGRSPLARAVSCVERGLGDEQRAPRRRGRRRRRPVGRQHRHARRGCGTTARRAPRSSASTHEHAAPLRGPVAEQLGGLRGSRARRSAPASRTASEPRSACTRQRAAQRGAALLAVDLEGVVARRGAEDDAAAGHSAARGSSPRGRGRCPSGATAWRRRRGPCRGSSSRRCPRRRASSSARTDSWTSGPLKRAPNAASSSSTVLRAAEDGSAQPSVRTSTTPLRGPGHRAADEQQVLVRVDARRPRGPAGSRACCPSGPGRGCP